LKIYQVATGQVIITAYLQRLLGFLPV